MSKLSISNLGDIGPLKNKIINGDFDIWQRGLTFSSPGYTADRFRFYQSGGAAMSLYRSTGVPTLAQSGHISTYSLRADVDTADTSIAAGDYVVIRHKIEGYNIKDLMGKTITLSFWVLGTITGTYSCAFHSGPDDYNYVAEYTINESLTWEYKTITLDMADGSSGTWDYTNDIGLMIDWCLMTGSTYAKAPGSWSSGVYLGSTNQVNAVNSTDNQFRLSQVQLEIGDKSTQFENREIGQEIILCQRYFEKSYDLEVAPGTVSTNGNVFELGTRNTGGASIGCRFKTFKRSTPTVVIYNPATGASGYADNDGTTRAAVANRAGQSGIGYTTITSGVNTTWLAYHWTADSEL